MYHLRGGEFDGELRRRLFEFRELEAVASIVVHDAELAAEADDSHGTMFLELPLHMGRRRMEEEELGGRRKQRDEETKRRRDEEKEEEEGGSNTQARQVTTHDKVNMTLEHPLFSPSSSLPTCMDRSSLRLVHN